MNLLQLRTEVQAHGFDPTAFGSRITNYLNDAYLLICRRVDYYVDEATTTYATTAGQTNLTLPANWARIRSLLDLDLERELTAVGLRDVDRAAVTQGLPVFYAQDGQTLRIWPTADGVHNLELRYWLLPTPLATDTDVPTLPADWHRLLTEYAIGRCYEADDDFQTGQAWEGKFQSSLAQFEADQRFPSTDYPTRARSMWGDGSLGVGGWRLWPEEG